MFFAIAGLAAISVLFQRQVDAASGDKLQNNVNENPEPEFGTRICYWCLPGYHVCTFRNSIYVIEDVGSRCVVQASLYRLEVAILPHSFQGPRLRVRVGLRAIEMYRVSCHNVSTLR